MFKKISKILGLAILGLFFMVLMAIALFALPAVQNYVADFAVDKLKPILKTELAIDKLRIHFFDKVELKGIYLEDQKKDTLLYADNLVVTLNMWDLLNSKLDIETVDLSNFSVNLKQEQKDAPFNFQFIFDAFKKDSVSKPSTNPNPFGIYLRDVRLKNGKASYNILSEPETPGKFNINHIAIDNLSARIALPSIDMDKLVGDVRTLSFTEQSGLKFENLQVMVRSKGDKLWSNFLSLKINNTELKVSKAEYDTKSKKYILKAKSELIDPNDIALFVSRFSDLTEPFSFEVDVNGTYPQASLNNLKFSYGNTTQIDVSGKITDFTKFENTDFDVEVKQFRTTQEDLENLIRVPAVDYFSPTQLWALGNMELNLKAEGKINRFNYKGLAKTEQGNITFSGLGKIRNKFSFMTFEGPVTAENIQVANIIGEEVGVDDATLIANYYVELKKDAPVYVTGDGNIASVLYQNFLYEDLFFEGAYLGDNIAGKIHTDTENNKLNLNADFTFGENMSIDVTGNIDRLDLKPFLSGDGWQNPSLVTSIDMHMKGSTIDDLTGTLVLDSTSFSDTNFIYNPGPLYLQSLIEESGTRKIAFLSSILEGDISGNLSFATVANDLMRELNKHLPSLVKAPENNKSESGKNAFQFNLKLKNTEDFSFALKLPFYNVEPATINGHVDFDKSDVLTIDAYLPRFMFGKNDIRETRVNFITDTVTGINIDANTYLVQADGYINARLNTVAKLDSALNNLALTISNGVGDGTGNIQIAGGFFRDMNDQFGINLKLLPSNLMFNNKNLVINSSDIVYSTDRIVINNFIISENNMLLLGVDGVASKNADDRIRAYFNNTELGNLLSILNIANINGLINGGITIAQALNEPIIKTDNFRIDSITVYKENIGSFIVEGNTNSEITGFDLNAVLVNRDINNLDVNGFVPTNGIDPLDLDIRIDKLPLNWTQPFAKELFSELSGTLNSDINISGKISQPVVEGWLGIEEGLMKIAYSNVTYRISDTIHVDNDNIGLNNLVIRDNNNNTAVINVALTHANFGKMNYNAKIRLNDFLLLNNEDRTDLMAYGNLKLSGDVNVVGSSRGIFGDANLTNESASNVMVVLPQSAQANTYGGVIYVNTPQEVDSLSFLNKNKDKKIGQRSSSNTSMPISIRGFIELNPGLEMGVILNPTNGNALKIRGTGELNLNYNNKSEPPITIYGDYIAQEGNFHYNLQGLKSINFGIRNGSTITLIGDPMNTRFNVTAYNRVKADLSALSETFKYSTDLSATRVPVDAVLEISGDLESMKLNYKIELPDASDDIRQKVNSLINTDEQRIRQFAYLVTTGNFMSSFGSTNSNFGTNMFTSVATSALTKGLDALFAGSLSDNWSVNTNMETLNGDFNTVRMGVDIATSLLDDRLRITTNLSYGNNAMLVNQSAFMGEFELEYDINNWLMIRAYNRANERFYKKAPFTQGAGVVVTKEGKTFNDLFMFNFRRKEDE
ncbi:MAG: hypothetical protein WCR12_03450 [Dysgonamonadaceae bacterium]